MRFALGSIATQGCVNRGIAVMGNFAPESASIARNPNTNVSICPTGTQIRMLDTIVRRRAKAREGNSVAPKATCSEISQSEIEDLFRREFPTFRERAVMGQLADELSAGRRSAENLVEVAGYTG